MLDENFKTKQHFLMLSFDLLRVTIDWTFVVSTASLSGAQHKNSSVDFEQQTRLLRPYKKHFMGFLLLEVLWRWGRAVYLLW